MGSRHIEMHYRTFPGTGLKNSTDWTEYLFFSIFGDIIFFQKCMHISTGFEIVNALYKTNLPSEYHQLRIAPPPPPPPPPIFLLNPMSNYLRENLKHCICLFKRYAYSLVHIQSLRRV